MLLCFVVCLTLLASFSLPSAYLIKMSVVYMYIPMPKVPPFLSQDSDEDSCSSASSLDLPAINLPHTPRHPLTGT